MSPGYKLPSFKSNREVKINQVQGHIGNHHDKNTSMLDRLPSFAHFKADNIHVRDRYEGISSHKSEFGQNKSLKHEIGFWRRISKAGQKDQIQSEMISPVILIKSQKRRDSFAKEAEFINDQSEINQSQKSNACLFEGIPALDRNM